MKFNDLPQPPGKGCQPKTEKQADQWSYYDSIMTAWKFPKPLNPSLIENLNKALTGEPRGIDLNIWLEVINEMNEKQGLTNPFGFLRFCLMKRIPKP